MKITQKDFDKLKQMDRIEYRQKLLLNERTFKVFIMWGVGFIASAFLPVIISFLIFLVMIYTALKYIWGIEKIAHEYFKEKTEVKK